MELGNWEKAKQYLEASIKIGEQCDDQGVLSPRWSNLARIHACLNEYTNAHHCYKNSIRFAETLGDEHGAVLDRYAQGDLFVNVGRTDVAKMYLIRVKEVFEQLGDSQSLCAVEKALNALGNQTDVQ